ncbi:LOW QUALITY PROTEIN: uncharacterized protein LOC110978068 [Acanthaster planci]|uniref:glucan endo-1,3-beta-D-glucosidase n=1 Tax=Acanthaster planci TaxID=133434 RepID=A0A8B7Y9P2_ACAPL|nr:LOW QUALITY PROTEIN: uncharacterized protein LOC110978068 [Acanthaster planci]
MGVAPPQRTGSLRMSGGLPTGDFACNQINHGPLTPIRQFPPSALITDDGITYDAFTLDRWNHTDRQDPFYQLTPGRAGAPWEKVVSLGTNMKQIASGPDGAPLAAFTGSSGVRLGIVNTGEPVLTDFGEMYANFLYTDKDGGTMELPIVRGSAMLTHIFTKANPMMWPYCLVAVNGQSVRYECPEERFADRGSGYVRASCSYVTMELILEIHFTKAITNIADVQWAATEESRWSTGRVMHTYNSTVCNMGSTGHIVTVNGPKCPRDNAARRQRDRLLRDPETRLWERLLGHHTSAGRLYGAWRPSEPVVGYKATVLVLRKCRCQRDVQSGQTGYNHRESQSSGRWIGRADSQRITISTTVTYDDVSFAVNVIGQEVTEALPFNWRRQPEGMECLCRRRGSTAELTRTPRGSLWLYFSEEMRLVFPAACGSPGTFSSLSGGQSFTGVMQLVYAGTGPKGDFSSARYLDQYAGVFAYSPRARFCTEGDKVYISFDWNKQGGDFYGQNLKQQMLTVVLPHQELLLPKENLVDTPFGFKGHVGDVTIMEEDLPRASMEPDPKAIQRIKDDPDKLKDLKDAMDKDAAYQTLVADCSNNNEPQSYWAGKSIGMVARLASISRAQGTNHYLELDRSLGTCLDMWLGVTGGLTETNSFRYDTVWGGMFIRSAEPGQPVYSWTNFGFVSYADHHFHLGYWLYAIAYYATYQKDWAKQESTMETSVPLGDKCQLNINRFTNTCRNITEGNSEGGYGGRNSFQGGTESK